MLMANMSFPARNRFLLSRIVSEMSLDESMGQIVGFVYRPSSLQIINGCNAEQNWSRTRPLKRNGVPLARQAVYLPS